MMSFLEFCKSKTVPGPITVDESLAIIDDKYTSAINVLIKNTKNKVNVFNKINIAYVENVLSSDEYVDILKDKLVDDEIPDSVLIRLSQGIYNKNPSELNEDETSIIKSFTVYICIQN